MLRKKIVFLIIILILNLKIFSTELKLKSQIFLRESSTESILSHPGPFCPIENKYFLIADIKEDNFKVFDLKGNHTKTWGRGGQGPGEIRHVRSISYYSPFVYILDSLARRVTMYKYEDNNRFVFHKDMRLAPLGPSATLDGMKVNKAEIFIFGTGMIDGQEWSLYAINPDDKKINGLVPYPVKFGFSPYDSDWPLKIRRYQYMVTPGFAYFDYCNDIAFLIWPRALKIIAYNWQNKKWISFVVHKTTNFRPDKPVSQDKYFSDSFKKNFEQLYLSISHIFGILANDKVIGVLFSSYLDKKSLWQTYLQVYSHNGQFIKEIIIPEGKGLKSHPQFYYDKNDDILYLFQHIPSSKEISETKTILIYNLIN